MATGNSKIPYVGFEIMCKCGDHITLTKTETNTYTGVCLGCGIDYVLTLIPFEEEDEL